MTDQERQDKLNAVHKELEDFMQARLPKRVGDLKKGSVPVAFRIVAIVHHPDGSLSAANLTGGINKDMVNLLEDDIDAMTKHPDSRSEYSITNQ